MSKDLSPSLGQLLQSFFCQRLLAQQHASTHTVASYRDTVRLLLAFVQEQRGRSPSQQSLADWNAPTILAFLDYLEQKRGCQVRTRNARLAGLRAFMCYVAHQAPEALAQTNQILAIPLKRYTRRLVQPLSPAELEALLQATDPATQSGRRDHLLFNLLLPHRRARLRSAGTTATRSLLGSAQRAPVPWQRAQRTSGSFAQTPAHRIASLSQRRSPAARCVDLSQPL